MSAPLERAIEQSWPQQTWGVHRVLVAISGGADSVALLRALLNLAGSPLRLSAAHFNHGWRGAESDGDEQFVAELCSRHGVDLHVGRGHTTDSNLVKSEENARAQRYQFLIGTAYQVGARYVCTAHTASDRIETMLHNLFRGTGLAGVCAPSSSRTLHDELLLVRPLLAVYREDVLAYLSQLGQKFRTDSSNFDESFKRNYIRHNLLPQIREVYGEQVDHRLAAFAKIAEEAVESQREAALQYQTAVDRMSALHFSSTVVANAVKQIAIPNLAQLQSSWPVVHQALIVAWHARGWSLQAMSREHWQVIRRAWESKSGIDPTQVAVVAQLPNHLELCRMGSWILIREVGIKKTRSPGHENNKDDDCSQRAPR